MAKYDDGDNIGDYDGNNDGNYDNKAAAGS